MDGPNRAAILGAGSCLGTVVVIGVPYVVPTRQGALTEYYGAGAVGPLAVALLGLVAGIAFLAGAYERSDPGVVAGLTLVAGAVSFLLALEWLLSLGSMTVSLGTTDSPVPLTYHPWAVLGGAAVWTGAAAWYAAALGLLGVEP